MSKTSRKSLPTLLLALCLLIGQAALLTHASPTHAATGPQIFLSAGYSSFTTGANTATIKVTGTGFAANSNILVTFNAAYSADGTPLAPRSYPPNELQAGDNQSPFPDFGTNLAQAAPVLAPDYPNSIQVVGTTDANGNLMDPVLPANYVPITIPSGAADGVYAITATDAAGYVDQNSPTTWVAGDRALAWFTINHGSTAAGSIQQPLTASAVYSADSRNSVSIEGLVNVTAQQNTFNSGDEVYFYLDDFAATNFNAAVTAGTGTTGAVHTLNPAGEVPLEVISCGSVPVTPGNNPLYCPADINGALSAVVQIQSEYSVQTRSSAIINSLQYYDQVYTVVARAEGNVNGGFTSGAVQWAGIHLDHGQTSIALSTNQQTLGGAFTVNGSGFGAYDTVQLYYVTLVPSNLNVSPFFSTPILLGTAQTDGAGHFLSTVALNGAPGLFGPGGNTGTYNGSISSYPGFVLAEDFSTSTAGAAGAPGLRLNEAATAAFAVTNTGAQSNPLTLTGQSAAAAAGAVTGNSITVAVSSTVTVQATGFTPGEAVSFTLAGNAATTTALFPPGTVYYPGGNGAAALPCDAYPISVTTANAQGVATATFLVPENCNTVTVTSNATINGGASAKVSAIGQSSGTDDTGTLIIPPTAGQVVPTTPYAGSQSGTGIAVNLIGSGFSANEPVTFQFYQYDPFLGGPSSAPVLSISAVSDVSGNVSIPAQIPAVTGGIYDLKATGLASGFTTNTTLGLPFVYINGNLNCPTNVLPGQGLVLSGANFANATNVLVTLTPNLTSAPTLTNALPAPVLSQVVPVSTSGTFVFTPTIPLGTASGSYTVTVSGLVASPTGGVFQEQLRQCVVTIGTVAPAIGANPVTGPIGTQVMVTGTGFGVTEPIQLSLQYIDATGALTGTDVPGTAQVVSTTTTTGAFTSTYTVSSNVNALIAGQYYLTAKGLQTGAIARTLFVVTGSTQTPNPTNIYFAEGFTGSVAGGSNADFSETLSILNANNYTTTYTVTYYIQSPFAGAPSTTQAVGGVLGPNSVVERSVNTDVGANKAVAASVSSPAPISADRIIARSVSGKALDSSASLGQLVNTAATAPTGGFNYYYATGDATLTNEEYLTLLNPGSKVANVTVNILPQAPISSTTVPTIAPVTVVIQPLSRATVNLRHMVLAAGGGVTQYGAWITSDQPIASERVEYFGDGIGSGKYGSITTPAGTSQYREQVFAQDSGVFPSSGGNAAAGTGNDSSQIDIVNPGDPAAGSATVTVSAFSASGAPINSQQVQVDGGTRETVNVNDIVGVQSDVFSIIVTSDKNVYVEQATFYGGNPSAGGTFAAAGAAGSPAGLTSVAFPYLDLSNAAGTTITQTVYLYNPGATAISVTGTFVSQTGAAPVVKTYTVNPNSVTAVNVNADAASLPKGALGGIFQVVNVGGTAGNTGASFVAKVVSATPGFAIVVGTQGSYAIGAAQGS